MFKIGEFSNLTKTTVKTLRYYEEVGLLKPEVVDEWTGYRYYSTKQLYPLQRIMALRQAGLSIGQIQRFMAGRDPLAVLEERRRELEAEKEQTASAARRLDFIIQHFQEDPNMNYQAITREIPAYTVYYKQGRINNFNELKDFILQSGEECRAANPGIKCVEPDYCYVSYLDPEFRTENMQVEYAQAVTKPGKETATIKFKTLTPVQAICVMHRGPYEGIGEAFAFALNFAEQNGWKLADRPREQYIDGIWNKTDPADWLTEIQIPVIK